MKKRILLSLIGIAIFLYILGTVGLDKVLAAMAKADLNLLILAVFVVTAIFFAKGLKWQLLIKAHKMHLGLLDCTKFWIIGFSIGAVTPARLGDFSRAYFVRKKMPLPVSLSSILLDRIMDIAVLFALSIYSISTFSLKIFGSAFSTDIILIAFFVFIIAAILLLNEGVVRYLVSPIANLLLPEGLRKKLSGHFNEFYKAIATATKSKRLIVAAFIVGVINWLASIFVSYLISLSLGLNIPYTFLLAAIPLATLMELLPVTILGLGTREATLILIFSTIGIATETTVAFSMLGMTIGTLYGTFAGLLLLTLAHQSPKKAIEFEGDYE